MSSNSKQVFQTDKPIRWKSFKWVFRSLFFLTILIGSTYAYSLFHSKDKPEISFEQTKSELRKLTKTEIDNSFSQKVSSNFRADVRKLRSNPKAKNFYDDHDIKLADSIYINYPIRAAFYVGWDEQSRRSLTVNASELNVVLPEWFFVSDSTDVIENRIDTLGLNIMRKEKVAIIPMVSNAQNGLFDGKRVDRIISSPKRRARFIHSLVTAVDQYNLQGVNIDFENLDGFTKAEHIYQFLNELQAALKPKGYLLTQDVHCNDPFLDLEKLGKYNDLLFLMAYDQHFIMSLPGPVAPQKWVEEMIYRAAEKVPLEKIVPCIPGYGYDWEEGCVGSPITNQRALSLAAAHDVNPRFDTVSHNITFDYIKGDSTKHTIWYADASTNFNAMRMIDDIGAAGTALWRLGAEDSRLWEFYKRLLSFDSFREDSFDFKSLSISKTVDLMDLKGAGEIIYVESVPQIGDITLNVDSNTMMIENETYNKLPTSCIVEKTGLMDLKNVAITFDDGPSDEYTPKILDILSKYQVKATFFVVGSNAEENLPIISRMYKEGHEIGNHTYTHIDMSRHDQDRILLEIRATNRTIEAATGHSAILFRAPYCSEPVEVKDFSMIYAANQEGMLEVSTSIDPRDWEKGVTADSIIERVKNANRFGNIILFHDAGGNRDATIEALPAVIEYLKSQGTTFVTVSELMNKKREELMPKVDNAYTSLATGTVVQASYYWRHFLYTLFLVTLIMGTLKLFLMLVFTLLSRIKEKRCMQQSPLTQAPKVSILVPAYNEEVNIIKSIENLTRLDYPNFEIVCVDDGSKDNTYKIASDAFCNHPIVKVFNKPNGGKASALNFGIEHASGEILVCIDADTVLKPDALKLMVARFIDDRTAAIAGNVKVGNPINMLTNWQSIEYITSQNFDRRAYDFLNAIMVVPGAIGAFRRDAMIKVGGFTTDTLAEDCDLTLRLLNAGYRVRNCNEALSYTEVPETLHQFMKQRFRWTFGIMQSFWKHRDNIFNVRKPNMGLIVLPNVLLFQMVIPIFAPIVDLMMIYSIFAGNAHFVLEMYFAYLLFDICVAMLAYKFDNEKFTFNTLWRFVIQRILYRQLMWWNLMKAYRKAIKGEMATWGVLKRTGNVSQI